MADRLQLFAPCARGLEPLLADELRAMRMRSVRPQRSGVLFAGGLREAYRACLWSRLASRVLLSLATVSAQDSDSLYEGVREIAWEEHVSADGTLIVDATGGNEKLRTSQFVAVRVKDAIVDRIRDLSGTRPSVDSNDPDIRVNVVVIGERARISLDLSGDALHRRGYRVPGVQVAAPIKETVAAGVLGLVGWNELAAAGGCFLDPMCGSGTIAIEAGMVAVDMAPGIHRARWGFDGWLGHDQEVWDRLLAEADERATAGLERMLAAEPRIFGSDEDGAALDIARDCVRRAGLDKVVSLEQLGLSAVEPGAKCATGLIATNPPYGERIGERRGAEAILGELGASARAHFSGWNVAIVAPVEIAAAFGSELYVAGRLMNGRIPIVVATTEPTGSSPLLSKEPGVGDASRTSSSSTGARQSSGGGEALTIDASEFENRLRKMARHWGRWARRSGVSCYRVYDADLPDFSFAVDVYAGAGPDEGRVWVHVAEYAAPREIDPEKARARLDAAIALIPAVLEVDPSEVFVKRRERQRGSSQYERVAERRMTLVVGEGGLLFEVNLSDYLDTGLFLDHRITRGMLRDQADGARFLNLFAYTGTATVYAADGGASDSLTVDLSATYQEWAARNMRLNGLGGPQHRTERADVLGWLEEAGEREERFDLIFCDPPTFSASKRMESTFDVQRDHVPLILAAARLLAPGGDLVFSCNRRKFSMDGELLSGAGLQLTDRTAETIPPDFERRLDIHSVWWIKWSERRSGPPWETRR